MDEKTFKSNFRPASCSQPPWASVIPAAQREETLKQIRKESIEIYGHSLDECPKRLTCLTKTCLGRPLPLKSPTAKPFIERMKQAQNINSSGELVLTNCDLCPISKSCKSTCAQVNDFMNRNNVTEPELIYRENLENMEIEQLPEVLSGILGKDVKIPWDAVTKTRKEIIKKFVYEQKDLITISKELGISDSARVKYELYSGLTTLSECGTVRTFLEEKGEELTKKQKDVLIMVYVANLNISQVAKVLEISKQSVQQIISRTVKKYGIKWTRFVKKEKNKLVYHIPELLK